MILILTHAHPALLAALSDCTHHYSPHLPSPCPVGRTLTMANVPQRHPPRQRANVNLPAHPTYHVRLPLVQKAVATNPSCPTMNPSRLTMNSPPPRKRRPRRRRRIGSRTPTTTVKSSSNNSALYAMIPQQRTYQLPKNIAGGVELSIRRGPDRVSVVKSASSVILSSRVISPGAPIAAKTSAFRVCLVSFAPKFQKPTVPTAVPSTASNACSVNTPTQFAQQMGITAGKAATSLHPCFSGTRPQGNQCQC